MSYATKKKLSNNSVVPLGSNLYGTCDTASGTAQKTVSMPDFDVLVSGVTIHVQFTHKNTASSPTLKVGSTSAVAIKRNGSLGGAWEDGSVISFTYDGTNWVQNDADDGSGTTYGLSYDASTRLLSLVEGGSARSVTIADKDTTYTISISGNTLTLTPSEGTAQSVTIPDTNTTYTISKNGDVITLTGSDGSTSTVTVTSDALKYVKDVEATPETFGVVINDVVNNVASGAYAVAEGHETYAEGDYAHSEGHSSNALGTASHSEGQSLAQGDYSHAEGSSNALGDYAHSEGNGTFAYAVASHAGGIDSEAEGEASFVHGLGLWSQEDYQAVFGKYNANDTDQAFIIGWGSSDVIKKNIFTVDKDGNVRALGLVNEVLIYDKIEKLKVQGTINSSADSSNGLLNQGQGEGIARDITSWNIEGMNLSAFRRLRIVYRRASDTLGSTGEFYLPIEGDAIPTRNVYQSGTTAPAHCNRNRLNTIACAVSGDKTKFCVTQTFSLYGTAATTISDMYVEKIYGCY